jgi:hypothetical protein
MSILRLFTKSESADDIRRSVTVAYGEHRRRTEENGLDFLAK